MSARVLRIIDRLNIGGPAKHVTWLQVGLQAAGFESLLIAGSVEAGEGDMAYFARELGVQPVMVSEMVRQPGLLDFVAIAKLIGHIRRFRPEIVHTHKSKAGTLGRVAVAVYRWSTPWVLLGSPRACPVVHTYHGHTFHSYFGTVRSWFYLTVERVLARWFTDRIVVVSEQQRQEICAGFRVGRADQYRVIPLGIDLDESSEPGKLRAELGCSERDLLVGIVGRLCEVKNHLLFLTAAARLVELAPSVAERIRFVVIGDGELRRDLELEARRLGIGERTAFTGFRKDAPALYADFDVVALTSLNEGTPLTLIEAMASGRAVAATEVGGVVDLLGERRQQVDGFSVWDHGVTARTKDVEGFAAALKHLAERPELRRQMGQEGRKFVRARLSRERLVADIADLYRDLVDVSPVAESGVGKQAAAPGDATT